MRVKKVNYMSKEALMIYITMQEKMDEGINNQIKELKKSYKDVAVFIGGSSSMEKALSGIIQENS
ncbi:MAG TPA: hypothetical protein VIK72_03095 [Clostridiaceae bacterium]